MNVGKQTSVKRLDYLDSVRGIAAMMVVVYHFIGWQWSDQTSFHLASMIFNGADAVSFFFVLSGFVLSYKYFHYNHQLKLFKFVYKRILRLYPAFIITVFINYFYWMREETILHSLNDIASFNKGLWQELAMVLNKHKYYNPGWTLGVEMVHSLLMPLMVFSVIKKKYLLLCVLPIIYFILPNNLGSYGLHFTLGAVLSYYYKDITNYDFQSSKLFTYRWPIAFVTFFFFSMRHIDRIFDFGEGYDKITKLSGIGMFHYSGIASFIILLYIINNKNTQKWLSKGPFLFLGKISYSVYLVHWIIVVIVMARWSTWLSLFQNGNLTFAVMLMATILSTVVFATIMYYGIEKPMIAFSKRTGKLFDKFV